MSIPIDYIYRQLTILGFTNEDLVYITVDHIIKNYEPSGHGDESEEEEEEWVSGLVLPMGSWGSGVEENTLKKNETEETNSESEEGGHRMRIGF